VAVGRGLALGLCAELTGQLSFSRLWLITHQCANLCSCLGKDRVESAFPLAKCGNSSVQNEQLAFGEPSVMMFKAKGYMMYLFSDIDIAIIERLIYIITK